MIGVFIFKDCMLNEIAQRESILTTAKVDKYVNLPEYLKLTEENQKEKDRDSP